MKLLVGFKQVNEVIAYCEQSIGPRRYYLHTAIGGEAWSIVRNTGYEDFTVTTQDLHYMTVIALKYGLHTIEE